MLRIALLIDTSIGLNRNIIRGIARYARPKPDWELLVELVGAQSVPAWRMRGINAAIGRPRSDAQADALLALDCPRFVFHSSSAWRVRGPNVFRAPDFCSATACQLAAKHLLAQGLRNFAFVGHPDWGTFGRDGLFAEALAEQRSGPAVIYEWPARAPEEKAPPDLDHLAEWLRALPRPVGILATSDLAARYVLDGCRHAGLRVPEQVAVMGIDDDEFICELTTPALTSVVAPGEQMGYAAAKMVARHLAGEPTIEARPIRPKRVAVRQSTDTIGVTDPDVARAVRYIRENAVRGVSVEAVAAEVSIARRTLEVRMRRLLGTSPAAEIERVRIQNACELIAAGQKSIKQISLACGYPNAPRFCEAFVRVMGTTPSAYRHELMQ